MEDLSEYKLVALNRGFSDHFPNMFHNNEMDFGPLPFKKFHSWISMEGFDDLIKVTMESQICKDSDVFHDKLKSLKGSIKEWVKEKRISLKSRASIILEMLAIIENKIDSGAAIDSDYSERLELLHELGNIQNMEDKDVIQKSKIKWNVEGDENTKYFHGMLKHRRSKQKIQGLSLNGVWVMEPSLIKNAFKEFYRFKFAHNPTVGHAPILQAKQQLSIDYNNLLQKSVTEDEIRAAERFLEAFIKGRQILDGPMIVSELFSWYKQRKKKLMIFKVDFEKFYDTVSWDFLDHMFVILEFGDRWRAWIRMFLYNARTPVLVNGHPTGEFQLHRGLRQGDLLSPFLFLIIMEGLHLLLIERVEAGAIHGVKVGLSDLKISHLFYADDAIILSEWNKDKLDHPFEVHLVEDNDSDGGKDGDAEFQYEEEKQDPFWNIPTLLSQVVMVNTMDELVVV
ncbi:uncharacterized protein [Rutidosis leptorrhynchoides]|uniref:uncharacterized protein n=1 Tax=Rutidosis leptorrhynchoides TaxID=125765 RepID=UPI003A9A3031